MGFPLQQWRRKGVAGPAYEAQFGSTIDDFTASGTVPVVEANLGTEWEQVIVQDPLSDGVRCFGGVSLRFSTP